MKFYEALKECIENGYCITRADWNGKKQFVFFIEPSESMSGYFVLRNAQKMDIIGWSATQTDMYSDKWQVLDTDKWTIRE